jgi:hypothetical protein
LKNIGSRIIKGRPEDGIMTRGMPLLVRFFTKLVFDILPAALASVIGGFLFTHYDWGQVRAPAAAVEQASPASAEMMQLVRDEHAVVASYLKAQVAAERDRLAAEDAAAAEAAGSAAGDASAPAAPGGAASAAIEATPLAPLVHEPSRPFAPIAAAPPLHTPLVIAQAEPNQTVEPPGYEPAPLLAATINIKDHVVSTTQHAFAVITNIPSWIATLGGRISGERANDAPAGRFEGEAG